MDEEHREKVLEDARGDGRVRKSILTGTGGLGGGLAGFAAGTLVSRDPGIGLITGLAGAGLGAYLGRKKGKKIEKRLEKDAAERLEKYDKLSEEDKREVRQRYLDDLRAARQEHLLRSQNRKLRHIRRNQIILS